MTSPAHRNLRSDPSLSLFKHVRRRKCPMNKVPYDVLCEIFIHCLPEIRYSLSDRQPNPKVAPILLCQVCSTWRNAALSSATLWSRLSFRLTVQVVVVEDRYRWAVFWKELAFLRWWRKNHGSIAPYLCFSVNILEQSNRKQQDHLFLDTEDHVEFILQYLTTAQYLDVDVFFWQLVQEWIKIGNHLGFPYLHTLVRNQGVYNYGERIFHNTQIFVGYQPTCPPSLLRRLCINGDIIVDGVIPSHWSTLTSISFSEVDVSPHFWYDLFSEVPQLQFGYFNINHLEHLIPVTHRDKCTLRHLSSLFLEFCDQRERVEFPLCLLFTHLYLPALRTLSLSSYSLSWKDQRALTELNTVLISAPNITTLALRDGFLSFGIAGIAPQTILSLLQAAPIWTQATHLAHMQLEVVRSDHHHRGLRSRAPEENLTNLIRDVFFPANRWLDLANPECTIRKFTIADRYFDRIEEFAMERLRELTEKMPNLAFAITAVSESERVQEAWMEWGLRSRD